MRQVNITNRDRENVSKCKNNVFEEKENVFKDNETKDKEYGSKDNKPKDKENVSKDNKTKDKENVSKKTANVKEETGSITKVKDMDIYLRMTSANPKLVNFYDNVLVKSMSYFWPDNFSMVNVLDKERNEDKQFGNAIQKRFPFPKVCYMKNVQVPGYSGRDRMQRDMFYPELCTSKKFVAYVDTDTMFVSRVVPEMLFVDGKPKVIGVYGHVFDHFWEKSAQTVLDLFKTKEVMRCMSHFPVIMKVEHMVQLREHLEKLHGMTFDELLINKTKIRLLGQFNMMCQYIWMFHRGEYDFHFQYQRNQKPGLSSAARESENYYRNLNLSPNQTYPLARVSIHYKWILEDWQSQRTYRYLFKSSICFMGGFELCPSVCIHYSKDSLRKELFHFDLLDWTWDSRCMEAQRNHYTELAKYDTPEYREIIKKACHDVDSLVWKWNKPTNKIL